MKKAQVYLTCFLLLAVLGTTGVLAQAAKPTVDNSNSSSGIAVPNSIDVNPVTSSPVFGQDHSYSVVFRGNGEAVVTLRVAFTNTTYQPLNSVQLRLPKVIPTQLSAYQIILGRNCSNPGPQIYDSTTNSYRQGNCMQYQEPDYYQSYYYNAKYQKADASFSGDTVTVNLPNHVPVNASGAFFLYYRAMGYAKRDILSVFNFNFETMKVEDSIRNLKVGISTDSDLVLKGAGGNVNYRFEAPTAAMGTLSAAGSAMANPSIDSYVGRIGNGSIVKSASNLSSLESYSVKGSYAKSNLLLYTRQILIGLFILLIIILLAILIIKKVLKRLRQGEREEVKVAGEEKKMPVSFDARKIILALTLSFIASILMVGYTVAIFFLSQSITSTIGYQYEAFFVLFIVIISFCIYAFLLFGPALYMGIKKGIGWGLGTIGLTIIWLCLFLFVGLFVVFLINPANTYQGTPIF